MLKKTLSALTVMAALVGPALVPATALAQPGVELKFYDRSHKDYHQWNGDEDHFYRQYLTEHHRKYRSFSRMNKSQQRAYWQWRHDHR